MALVDDDEVEEIRVKMLVDLLAVEILVQILVVGKVDLADFVDLLLHGTAVDDNSFVLRKGGKGTIRLILEVVPVGKEKDTATFQDISLKQFPHELEHRESLAGTGGHQQKDAPNTFAETT